MAANACKDLLKSPWRKRTCGLDACAEFPAPEPEESEVQAAVDALPVLAVGTAGAAGVLPNPADVFAGIFGGSPAQTDSRCCRTA